MLELTIPAMTCGHCASRITAAIAACDADARTHVTLASKQVAIETDASPPEAIVECLAQAGYPAL